MRPSARGLPRGCGLFGRPARPAAQAGLAEEGGQVRRLGRSGGQSERARHPGQGLTAYTVRMGRFGWMRDISALRRLSLPSKAACSWGGGMWFGFGKAPLMFCDVHLQGGSPATNRPLCLRWRLCGFKCRARGAVQPANRGGVRPGPRRQPLRPTAPGNKTVGVQSDADLVSSSCLLCSLCSQHSANNRPDHPVDEVGRTL